MQGAKKQPKRKTGEDRDAAQELLRAFLKKADQ